MATTFAEYKAYITPDVLPCPDPIVERELISTLIDFCKLTHCLTKDFNVELDSDDIDSEYQDSIDISLSEYFTDYRPVAVIAINIDGVDYVPEYKEVLNTIDAWDSSLCPDNVKFFFFLNNTTLRLYDMATGDTNLYLRIAVKPIRAITEVQDEFLFEDHIDTIAAGVKFRILKMPGKVWSDQNASKQNWIDWRRGVTKARANQDRGHTKNPQTVYPVSFGGLD